MITPAISVLSAVEGVEVAPAFWPYVLPISLAVLTGLFVIQRKGHGQGRGGFSGPVMLFWFTTLGVLRGSQRRPPPGRAAGDQSGLCDGFLRQQPMARFSGAGAVVPAITGGEALYADMEPFQTPADQGGAVRAMCFRRYLNYLGQGALILDDPTAVEEPPSANLVPDALMLPMVGLATLATSSPQAGDLRRLLPHQTGDPAGLLPRMHVIHTSEREIW